MAVNFTEDNRRYFDDLAAKYDIAPWIQELSAKITLYIQQQRDFLYLDPQVAEDASLLDYACGTGLLSRALGPYVNSIQALDLSANMVTRYKELSALSSIPSVRDATARTGNLLIDELEGQELQGFSIAAICAALHHVADPASLITRLAGRLRAGGVLAVIDFVDEGEAHFHVPTPAKRTIHKQGFSEEEIKTMMEKAGLVDFGWKEMPDRVEMKFGEKHSVWRTVFLARAVLPNAS